MPLLADSHGYGQCPHCGDQTGFMTERRPSGFTRCGQCGNISLSHRWGGGPPDAPPPEEVPVAADVSPTSGDNVEALQVAGMGSFAERDAYAEVRAAALALVQAERTVQEARQRYLRAQTALTAAIEASPELAPR